MTLQQTAGRIRKALLDFPCRVRTTKSASRESTASGVIDIECAAPLPPHVIEEIEAIYQASKTPGKSRIVMFIEGRGYPSHGAPSRPER
jgi:hypothetical protein